MVVDQKITEAEYFLDKIKTATRREDLIPNLSAFLSSTRSIVDYLLEDYNVKFGLKNLSSSLTYMDFHPQNSLLVAHFTLKRFFRSITRSQQY